MSIRRSKAQRDKDNEALIGKKVYFANGRLAGIVAKTSTCTVGDCGGARLHVRGSRGRHIYPCVKGCDVRGDGNLQIQPEYTIP